nr:pilus assembly protein PilM [Nitrospiraceae bacterium]
LFPTAKTTSGRVIVGVDIGHKNVNLVKAAKSHGRWEIPDWRSIPIPGDIGRGSDEFDDFLRREVSAFCGHAGKTEIWAVMSSAQAHVQLVRIPKVSGEHFEAAVQWGLKKEIAFEEKDYSFGYEMQGEVIEGDVKKNNVMCYFAPVREIERAKNLFSRIGAPLTGVSIVPFAVQNIFMNYAAAQRGKNVACLFIGNDFSRIDLYTGGKLALSRDIKTGVNSMIEMLMEEVKGRGFSNDLPGDGGRALSNEEARKILLAFSRDGNEPIPPANGSGLGRAEAGGIVAPVIERITRQIERTFKHFEGTQGRGKIDKLFISSVMPCKAICGYFSEQLGIGCAVFDPLGQALEACSPDERIALVPAFGMALSDAHTPNFILSYKEIKRRAYIARVNRVILAAMAASLLVCSALTAYEWHGASRKKAELAALERQLQTFSPVSKGAVLKMADEAGQKARQYAGQCRRERALALIGEISRLTPASVSLSSLNADLAENALNTNAGAGQKENGNAVISGAISGDANMLEAMFAMYVMRLRSSPLFSGVSVSSTRIERDGHGASLAFTLALKMGRK